MTGLVACLLAAAGAGAATTTEVRSGDSLTAHETLRGSMRFRTPPAWRVTPKSGVDTARFEVEGARDCAIEVSASIRGKATRRSAIEQARAAVGSHPAAAGRRAGGVYRVGRTEPSATATSWLYGIAVVRVARRRFGQLRIFASFSGPDCSTEAAPGGDVTTAMTTVLRKARSHLRVVR
jgi:hypothetical protein